MASDIHGSLVQGMVLRKDYKLENEVTNRCFAYDCLILLASTEVELRELEDHLHWVGCEYSLLINTDKTKMMASYGAMCHISIQCTQLENVDTFPHC